MFDGGVKVTFMFQATAEALLQLSDVPSVGSPREAGTRSCRVQACTGSPRPSPDARTRGCPCSGATALDDRSNRSLSPRPARDWAACSPRDNLAVRAHADPAFITGTKASQPLHVQTLDGRRNDLHDGPAILGRACSNKLHKAWENDIPRLKCHCQAQQGDSLTQSLLNLPKFASEVSKPFGYFCLADTGNLTLMPPCSTTKRLCTVLASSTSRTT